MNPKLRVFLTAERAFGVESIRRPAPSDVADTAAAPTPPRAAATAKPSVASPPSPAPSTAMKRPATAPPAPQPAIVSTFAEMTPTFTTDQPFTAPLLPTEQKIVRLATLDETQVRGCPKCRLCETRTQTVFGEGDVDAKLMFIGEGPGENEDLTGRPFVGRAGQLLDKMILAMGLQREQTYIANVVKCRPPNNRAPIPDETIACTPYLLEQIETIRPQVIVTLGLPATRFILQLDLSMGKMRGQFHDWRGLKVMPTYHPSYVLRSYTPQTRAAVWSDLQQVMQLLGLKGAGKKTDVP